MKIHIVQKGDTLWKIAKKYGVNFEELKKMNSQLSNPDMIMPGMKVKVPTSGGMIKKEAPMGTKPGTESHKGVKKEIPLEHPYAKEKPMPAPIEEAPVKEVPILKEAPKAPYTPKMPLPVIPEIDINNYYMMNMANMTVQPPPQPQPQLPPKPVNILPEVKEVPKKEMPQPVVEKPPVELPPQTEQPVCQDYCVPVTPVLPGPGFCPPEYPPQPMMPIQQVPYNPAIPYGVMPEAPVPAQPIAGASFVPPQYEDESSSSFMPQMPINSMVGAVPGIGMQGYMMNPQGIPVQGVDPHYSMNPQGVSVQGVDSQYPAMNPQSMPMQGMEGQYPMMNPQGMPMQGMEGQYPMMNPQGMPMQGMEGQYPMMNPQGMPMQGYPEYPSGYSTGREPVQRTMYPTPYGSPGIAAPYAPAGMMYPYGQPTYGHPQMGTMYPGFGMGVGEYESPDTDSPEVGSQPYPLQGQIPVSTGGLGDCGCSAPVQPNFIPPTPPIYSAPYTTPTTFAQPPYMNPYGMPPMGTGSYAMPRYEADGYEEEDD